MNFPSLAVLGCMVFLGALVGCNLPAVDLNPSKTASAPAQYETVAVMLTRTASVSTGAATRPTPAASATPPNIPQTETVSPILTTAVSTKQNPSPTQLCNLASAGVPIDVTIQDDTRMQPGESFAKVWRLVNSGACPWTHSYSATWFSGDNLGLQQSEPFNSEVPPGGSIDLSIDMVAPEKPGVYQSNWKIRSDQGELFGIGPGGGAPFWVRIQVVAIDTVTPTSIPPTPTPTPLISNTGSATLKLGEGIDVDTGQISTDDTVDFILQGDSSQMTLSPANNARATLHGANRPDLSACRNSELSAQPILLGTELEGSFLCIQTSRGLPGSVQISALDLSNSSVSLSFTVWSVP